MDKGQSQTKAKKGMRNLVSGRSSAVLVAIGAILLSRLAFGLLKKKRKIAERESTREATPPSSISPISTGEGSDQYDVFLSFRGLDTREKFADHLYQNLVKEGTIRIAVFRDENSLHIGEEFSSQILDAISRSRISIPIISKKYASSKWCLRELICMMERSRESVSHKVLPIFYEVAPSDVRRLSGNFGMAFHSAKKHFDEDVVKEGPRALRDVSFLTGWESKKFANGYFSST